MERKIGESFEYNGISSIIVHENISNYGCSNCIFNMIGECNKSLSVRGECCDTDRSGNKSVVFILKNTCNNGRMINLSPIMANELLRMGGKFRELALSVFDEKELILVSSWTEFVDKYPEKYSDVISLINSDNIISSTTKDLIKIEVLRDHYRNGWVPSDSNMGYSIAVINDDFNNKYLSIIKSLSTSDLLSFPDESTALLFSRNFKFIIIKLKKYL